MAKRRKRKPQWTVAALETWPHGEVRVARKRHRCHKCDGPIEPREPYFDPGNTPTDELCAWGPRRHCRRCAGIEPRVPRAHVPGALGPGGLEGT